MGGEMDNDQIEEMDMEVLSSMWPDDVENDDGKQFNVERPGGEQDMFEEVTFIEEPAIADFKRLSELTSYSEKGSSQLAYLVKSWESRQANAVRLLNEEMDILSRQRQEVELKKLEILEEHRFEDERYGAVKRPVSILDDFYDTKKDVPPRKSGVVIQDKRIKIDAEYDTIVYWKQHALHLEKLLEASIQREQILMEKLQENVKNLESQSSPVQELSQILERADNFLHFILQNAPVVIGHQDKDLRYRFIYNHFPSFKEEDIIGKTDTEIFTGAGVKENQDFKREVLERGLPAKREITFETPLFGSKTFLIFVEPVFSKAGETIGVNYMGMDVTDQVKKREKMARLREEIAVQKAKESELNKTIHITEETMRAKQMLATMSHEIRSPLSGVVSMTEILATTKLDREQKQLLDVMLSSGDLVLQLINDILDLSKVESGVMKLEATKFRPREVVRHVLQTAAASLKKILILEGNVADDVPIEVIGDVLRIRQILTNLISNAVKFTHEGKVGIKISVVPEPSTHNGEGSHDERNKDQATESANRQKDENCLITSPIGCRENGFDVQKHREDYRHNYTLNDEPTTPSKNGCSMDVVLEEHLYPVETTVWIQCDVYDTGIGIPDDALPTLFKKYMQVSADHARKYGGTGLGLAICKELVELMGGYLTVSSRQHNGSTFTFVLPYKVSNSFDHSDDSDDLSGMVDDAQSDSKKVDITAGFFQFQPRALGSLFSSSGSNRTQKLLSPDIEFSGTQNVNGFSEQPYSFPYNNGATKEIDFPEDASSAIDVMDTIYQSECSIKLGTEHDSDALGRSEQVQKEECNAGSQSVSSNSTEPLQSSLQPKILLVEDNKINVMVTQSMMKRIGYAIEVVNNGVEAVRAVQHNNYDLILMDVCMPIMDGLQATRLIRSFEETGNWNAALEAGIEQPVPSSSSLSNGHSSSVSTKRVPIIAMTANAVAESGDECYANGMDSFVSKPVTFHKLKQCLEKYLPSFECT